MSPVVSVVIPTRDRPELLERAMSSVLSQTVVDWECIVVDDASADAPSLPADSRFSLIINNSARGPGGARNVGLRRAKGEYVLFLDDDDELEQGALHALLAQAEPYKIVFGLRGLLGSNSQIRQPRWNGNLGGSIIDNSPMHCQGLYPRATCELYDESFRTGEDFDWLLRMGLRHSFVTVDKVTYLQRIHDGPRPDLSEGSHLEGRLKLLKKHADWFSGNPKSRSVHLARAAASALNLKKYGLARVLARRSFLARPNMLAVKIFLLGLGFVSIRES